MKKLLVFILALLMFASVGHADYGLRKWRIDIVDMQGEAITDANFTVTVYESGLGAAATILADEYATAKTNPITYSTDTAADTGRVSFYSASSTLDIMVDSSVYGSAVKKSGMTIVEHRITYPFNSDDYAMLAEGPAAQQKTVCTFGSNPVCMTITGADGAAAGGTTGDENAMTVDGTNFEYHILGAGQTITVPVQTALGLNVRLDAVDNEGMELGEGITASSKSAFTIGTDAFYLKVKVYLTDVNDFDIMACGFRLAEAYQGDLYAYNTYAGINVNNGTVNGIWELNGSDANETDMGDTWSDATAHTMEVRVGNRADANAVTQYLDGVSVTTPLVFAWSDVDTVVPFFHILGDASAAGEVALQLWECGLQ